MGVRRRSALSGLFGGISDALMMNVKAKQQAAESDRVSFRNDVTTRARTADEMIAKGTLDPAERQAFISGNAAPPSTADQLSGIVGGMTKAPTPQEVPTPRALAMEAEAKRIPTMGFGEMASGNAAPDPNALPSTMMGPASTPAFSQLLSARQDKIRSFPSQEIGADMGPSGQPMKLYGRANPDTGGMDTTQAVPAGPTAAAAGQAEGAKTVAQLMAQKLGGAPQLEGAAAGDKTVAELMAKQLGGAPQLEGQAAAAKTATQLKAENAAGVPAMQGRADATKALTGELSPAVVKAKTDAAVNQALAIHQGQLKQELAQSGMTPQQQSAALSLSDNFTQESKDYYVVEDQTRKISALANGPHTAGSDMALVFSFMKVLDPNSTVREGEQASARNATGVPAQIQNLYNRVMSGDSLTDVQRQDFLNQAATLYRTSAVDHDRRVKTYAERAMKFGVDPSLVVRPPAPDLISAMGGNALSALRARKQGGANAGVQ